MVSNQEPQNKKVLKLLLIGENLTQNPKCNPERRIIDFNDMPIEEASLYKIPFQWLKSRIPRERKNNRNEKLKIYWWKYEGKRLGMRKALKTLSYCFAVSEVSKWFIFIPCTTNWLSARTVKVVASDDYYILGILTSNVHRLWVKAQSSTLEDRTRYTNTTCFETFPFPQKCSQKIVQQIRDKTTELHEYRTQQMEKKQWGITQLYNEYFHEPASKLYQLHQQLDKLVMKAYNFNPVDDILSKLLELNLELANKEKRGEKVIGAEAPDNG